MSNICLVHLIRKQNGINPLKNFITSYNNYPAGMPHEILLIFKGFSVKDIEEYQEILLSLSYHSMFVSDRGFDIRPYFLATRHFNYEYYVFMNSYSVIQCKDWMKKMYTFISMSNVGAVGATGSWESLYSSLYDLEMPISLQGKANRFIRKLISKKNFLPFPNFHLRTNAFMTSRALMLKINVPLILNKQDAHKFESGINGFTQQILRMNKRVLVIGCDGVSYEKESWHISNTFRKNTQSNLLVADNQTNTYMESDTKTRVQLSETTWGKDKSPPS
jgi:hypothetical protein